MASESTYWALTSLDGRYEADLNEVRLLASEAALNKFRLIIEASWVLELSEQPSLKTELVLSDKCKALLVQFSKGQNLEAYLSKVKVHEQKTNHDVKACEYTLQDALKEQGADSKVFPWIHFACTSEDINNLSYALMLKSLRQDVIAPLLTKTIDQLSEIAVKNSQLAMMSRTHGQTATPTTLGKEIANFVRRLKRKKQQLLEQEIEGKINGAVGNYNAHVAALPQIDWIAVSKNFVEKRLGLNWNPLTTQIEPHDSFVEYMETLRHTNTILIDFARDMWSYISVGYFAQKIVSTETGSSTMPHKVNPIYFENAEGNLGVANSLLAHFGEKLPISRLQRDLSDSTVLRVTGTAIGHTVLAWKSILKGLSRVEPNPKVIQKDLSEAWEVIGEAVQTVMRRYGVTDAYERLKSATRGEAVVTREMIAKAIDSSSEIPQEEKQKLKNLTPEKYIGLAPELVTRFL